MTEIEILQHALILAVEDLLNTGMSYYKTENREDGMAEDIPTGVCNYLRLALTDKRGMLDRHKEQSYE